MIGWLGGLVRCLRGKHERSLGAVRKQGERYVSKCRYCRRPMVRIAKRNWKLMG